jgi:hypothetical protein
MVALRELGSSVSGLKANVERCSVMVEDNEGRSSRLESRVNVAGLGARLPALLPARLPA